MTRWSLNLDAYGLGVIQHHAQPRFTAYWTSGKVDLPFLLGQYWRETGSDVGDDDLLIYGIQWQDAPVTGIGLENLMQQACRTIDDWIAARL